MGVIRPFSNSMGAIAPINFEKGLIATIKFRWKQGQKGNLHPSIDIWSALLGILHPSIEIPYDTPENLSEIGFSRISYRCQKSSCSIPFDAKKTMPALKSWQNFFNTYY